MDGVVGPPYREGTTIGFSGRFSSSFQLTASSLNEGIVVVGAEAVHNRVPVIRCAFKGEGDTHRESSRCRLLSPAPALVAVH